jgi:predicted nucleic acid-binding protein
MRAQDVPTGTVLVDTDVVSWIALGEARAQEFSALLAGRELFISFATLAEVRTFLAMGALEEPREQALSDALNDYTVLPLESDKLVTRWVELRTATANSGTADDRERRQNDTWIAASALSADSPLPIATGNLREGLSSWCRNLRDQFGGATVARAAKTIRLLASVRSISGTAPGTDLPPPHGFR